MEERKIEIQEVREEIREQRPIENEDSNSELATTDEGGQPDKNIDDEEGPVM